jgi:hypothetical protein
MKYRCSVEPGVIELEVELQDIHYLTPAEKQEISDLLDAALARRPEEDDFWVEQIPQVPDEDWPLFVSVGDTAYEFWPD